MQGSNCGLRPGRSREPDPQRAQSCSTRRSGMNTCLASRSTTPVCHFRQWQAGVVTFFRCPDSSLWGPLQEVLFPVPSSVSGGGDRPHGNAPNTAGGPIPFLRTHTRHIWDTRAAEHLKSLPRQQTQGLVTTQSTRR